MSSYHGISNLVQGLNKFVDKASISEDVFSYSVDERYREQLDAWKYVAELGSTLREDWVALAGAFMNAFGHGRVAELVQLEPLLIHGRELFPDEPHILEGLASIYERLDRPREGADVLEALLLLRAQDRSHWHDLIEYYIKRLNFARASATVNRAQAAGIDIGDLQRHVQPIREWEDHVRQGQVDQALHLMIDYAAQNRGNLNIVHEIMRHHEDWDIIHEPRG